jgi:hypothetical protein
MDGDPVSAKHGSFARLCPSTGRWDQLYTGKWSKSSPKNGQTGSKKRPRRRHNLGVGPTYCADKVKRGRRTRRYGVGRSVGQPVGRPAGLREAQALRVVASGVPIHMAN